MEKYRPTIGLEIHAELKTRTKMFCDSKNDPDEKSPNVNICPICMGHPGTLPVINKEAVKHVLRMGTAVGGTIADFTEFDRKNYFYPDIPKGYQISQYKYPLVSGGVINEVELTRIHLEEDTARSSHETGDYSLVDFNRAGVPLMELVTEPVIHSAEQAVAFAKELQLLMQTLGVSEANMEKGEMRVEANISVSDTDKFGTKVEVKNLNSFRAVEKAVAYEIARHIEALERGEKIVQETRGWDENKNKTFSQRSKENAHDYRYFPDPDLPKLKLSEIPEFSFELLKQSLPELPWDKRIRYEKSFGLKKQDTNFLVENIAYATFFESAVVGKDKKSIELIANYLTSDVVGAANKQNLDVTSTLIGKLVPANLAKVIDMISAGELSSRGAKDVIADALISGADAGEIAREKNLIQKNDVGELAKIIVGVISENKKAVDEYKAGKQASLQFLIGQGMRATKGSANPEMLKTIFLEQLSK
ncbi:TPA: Asp-tRNA(Asn)/Glu-tRNA(Gln) amidotransferase subunit GatB [Candidatus Taylorbacteria bacterium]|nr:Asp-tRNA(Asn)/Glu-tRNA(Gln) amidotransferase subunit GatB [Candidatus Taylorbacteria bacterium]